MSNYKALLTDIDTFFFDVDGVMTDGSVILSSDGDLLRIMNVKDGYVLQFAVKSGYRIIIISGGRSKMVKKRFDLLGIDKVFLGVGNKIEVFEKLVKEDGIDPMRSLYMGDDIPDYQIMQRVKVACCPSDAATEIKKISHYISPLQGGKGCVRDIIEQVMKVQDKWMGEGRYHW